jgi:hypothetical protein
LLVAESRAEGAAGRHRVGDQDANRARAERDAEGEGGQLGVDEELGAASAEWPAGEEGEAEVVLARVAVVKGVIPITCRNDTLDWNASVYLVEQPALTD